MAGVLAYTRIFCKGTYFSKVLLFSNTPLGFQDCVIKYSSRKKPDVSHIPELNEPPFKSFYDAYYEPQMGRVYSKRPSKYLCQKGKTYYWCSCGHSHDQPFCDGREVYPENNIKLKPVAFKPQETREYWFCNCKQTKNRPFCDGSHNSQIVQDAIPIVKF